MHIRESIQFKGKELALETGRIARQASGAVLATHGDTHVLVTVVTAEPRADMDYFPLRVDYEERFYASGKIPGGFFKREGRPSDVAVLTGRMIDRPIRPLFPKAYNDEVQIVATVLSVEPDCPPSMLAIIGASAALMISGAPFQGPIAAVKVGFADGRLVVNPSAEAYDEAGTEMVVAGTKHTVTMVEGMMAELPESEIVEGIELAHEAIRELVGLQERFAAQIQTTKKVVEKPDTSAADKMRERVRAIIWPQLSGIHTLQTKKTRGEFLEGLRQRAIEQLVPIGATAEETAALTSEVSAAAQKLLEIYMREQILDRGIRLDGRRPEEIRPIDCQVGVLPRTHGSSLFTRGETQSLGIITLGATRHAEQIIDQMLFDGRKRFMLHYNFPPYSVGEVGRIGSPSRRSIGHGYLAENSLRPVLPSEEEFPYVVRIVSEILESNGSSSMATVCSASLAMMDAGVPIKKAVAGIAMGMIEDEATGRHVILTDIQGSEDHYGDMDFKVVGTRDGVTGFQLDVKVGGVSSETMREALDQARRARLAILAEMERAIAAPRSELSEYAPRLTTIHIPIEKIGLVIGPGGKTIRQIIEETGAEIDISDDGSVKLAGPDAESVAAAQEWITDLTSELEVGTILKTKVTRVVDFGAFVQLKGGAEGLVHVSNLASGFVDKVSDIVSVGDEMTIEVIGEDKMGRPDLKRIDGDNAGGGGERPERSSGRRDRGNRSDRSDRGGRRREESPTDRPSAPAVEVKIGDIIEGTVSNTTDYGAFVELTPEVTGLIHISALSDDYVRRVTDVVRSGDHVTVEVMNIDERGRYKLRRIVPESERKQPKAEGLPVDEQPKEEVRNEAPREPIARPRPTRPERQPEQPHVDEPLAEEPEPEQPDAEEPRQPPERDDKQPETDEFEDRW
ncbi:polyribonucleotide nucleotidyltransferase [Candidatus Bipolaricaulota bacterium]|nr:polyribonucleotide nucleotidyltransferase [Candidatus Bipolaricaulota bacterium]